MTDLNQVIAFMGLGTPEVVVILLVALLIWGRRLPEIARGMGKSVSEFKKGLKEAEQTQDEVTKEIQRAGDEATKDPGVYNKTQS